MPRADVAGRLELCDGPDGDVVRLLCEEDAGYVDLKGGMDGFDAAWFAVRVATCPSTASRRLCRD